ncbi:MAG: class IV adenylate cyclase [Bryobacteraceae bacterium]|jgi:adenylate cyclase class 2
MPVETEIKLPVSSLERARAAILSLGYQVHHERAHECNAVFDSRASRLRGKGQLMRLRRYGTAAILTFKGASLEGRHKQREEIEVTVSDADAAALILQRLGFRPVFRYEKFRTEYATPGEEGIITVDETPIGNFLELEGPAAWIDDVAARLGYRESDYIKLSYGALYNQHCESTGTAPGDMLFEPKAYV